MQNLKDAELATLDPRVPLCDAKMTDFLFKAENVWIFGKNATHFLGTRIADRFPQIKYKNAALCGLNLQSNWKDFNIGVSAVCCRYLCVQNSIEKRPHDSALWWKFTLVHSKAHASVGNVVLSLGTFPFSPANLIRFSWIVAFQNSVPLSCVRGFCPSQSVSFIIFSDHEHIGFII